MRRLLFFIFLLGFDCSILAIPAKRTLKSVRQSDNTTISILLVGDENVHFYITTDSIPVFETNNDYCYGYIKNDSLFISSQIAHNQSERKEEELCYIKKTKNDVMSYLANTSNIALKTNCLRLNKSHPTKSLGIGRTFEGEKRGLVILVDFANLSMASDDAHILFNRLFNERGYSDNGSIGSVHDYFYDQSYGKFDLSFDVIGPVKVSKNYEYYGGNSEYYGIDKNARDMVVEACQMVEGKVNFKDYDWDGDGEVGQVFIIYAGYGEHSGAPSNTIWPHENILGDKSITIDGVRINTYACSSELIGFFGKTISGIGTPCHEFCHCLGIPDFYDTDYSGAFGMSYWDVMNSGSYAGPKGYGEVPYGFTAYERWIAGWLEPIELTQTQKILNLANLGDTPEAYIIYNEGNRNEYYLIENHQSSGWFKYVDTFDDIHGMVITHVDYDSYAWSKNIVNPSPDHQRMTIIPADNSYGNNEYDLRGDVWPGGKNVQWLTNTSHVDNGGKLYNRNVDFTFYMNRAIGNIIENEDGTVSFDVIFDNDIYAPQLLPVSNINQDNYTINWKDVAGAQSYCIEQQSMKIGSNLMPTTKKEVIEGVVGTSLTLNWLLKDALNTQYRIRSVVNGIASEWSDFMKVEYDTGINDITIDEEINNLYYSVDGTKSNISRNGIRIIKNKNTINKYLSK